MFSHGCDCFALPGVQLAGEFGVHGVQLWCFATATHGVTAGFEDSDGLIEHAAI